MGRPHRFTLDAGLRLAPPPAGWFLARYAVTLDGNLAELCADHDILAAWAERKPAIPDGQGCIRLFTADGRVETGPRFALESGLLAFDRLPNGCWAIAETRCSPGEDNLRILQPDGVVAGRFCIGDGVKHLQCDNRGGIWVGYFDEGVYGNMGWEWHSGRPEPIGAAGLNCFSARGDVVWRLRPSRTQPAISDCYALNVSWEAAWACYYTDFPILRVEPDGDVHLWSRGIRGVQSLIVKAEHAVLFGGNGEERGRVALVMFNQQTTKMARTFNVEIEPGLPLSDADTVIGRGDRLHVVSGCVWRRASVA